MAVSDICFFLNGHNWLQQSQLDLKLAPFIARGATVRDHQEGMRRTVRVVSESMARELLDKLAASVKISSDIFISVPHSEQVKTAIDLLIARYLPRATIVKSRVHDVFLSRTLDRTKFLSCDIFLPLPEEEKRAVCEVFAAQLRVSGLIVPSRLYWLYIPKYL